MIIKELVHIDELKVGDRIHKHEGETWDSEASPAWGGKYGYVMGTVIDTEAPDGFPVAIRWDNEKTNGFRGNYKLVRIRELVQLDMFKRKIRLKCSNCKEEWKDEHHVCKPNYVLEGHQDY